MNDSICFAVFIVGVYRQKRIGLVYAGDELVECRSLALRAHPKCFELWGCYPSEQGSGDRLWPSRESIVVAMVHSSHGHCVRP